jgi:hypothetical protein
MSNEYRILEELSVGDKIRRQEELLSLLNSADPMDSEYPLLMTELSTVMKEIASFTQTFSENLKEDDL